jgi:SPP1 gp7 family putative phage head morphogenesis protein
MMISQITGEQRDVVRDVVSAAALGVGDWGDVAQSVLGSIGLTTQQAGWVSNHYDRAYLTAIRSGMGTAQARARARDSASRYQTSVHRYRANTIARTETMRAASEGRMQAWNQGLTQGFISPLWRKEWVAEANACEICRGVGGKKIGIKESFPVGEPPAHPNCRCDVILVPPKVKPVPADGGIGSTAFTAISTIDDLILLGKIPFPDRRELAQWRQAFQIATAPDRSDRRTFSEILNDLLEPDIEAYAMEGERITFEEIEEKADEIFDRGLAIADEAGADPMWSESNGSLGDSLLGALYEYTGYDAFPTILDDDEFNALSLNAITSFRGVNRYRWPAGELSPQQILDMYRSGRYFPGYGVYGNGTYSSTNPRVASGYGGADYNNVIRILLSPTANVADYNELAKDYRAWHDALTPEYKRTKAYLLLSDFGRWATAKGFDAIRIVDIDQQGLPIGVDDYVVILNRGVTYVPKQNGLGGRSIFETRLAELFRQENNIPDDSPDRTFADDAAMIAYAKLKGYLFVETFGGNIFRTYL